MRAKIVLPASVLALAVLLPALYFHYKSSSPPPAVEAVASDDSTNAVPSGFPPILKRASKGAQDQGAGVAEQENNDDPAMTHEEQVTKRKSDLYELGMSQDPAALKSILAEMHNPDPDIRKAALTATLDLGSPDAIPALQNELAWATDLQEKLDIQKAIEFLQLPQFGSDAITQQPNDK